MKENKRLVPKRRFREFENSGEWKLSSFGDIASYKKGPFGSALKKDIFVPKTENSVKIYEQQNAINKNWRLERYFITRQYANKMKTFEVSGGDVIVSCAGTIGETYVLPIYAEVGIINQALMRIRVNEKQINKTLFIHLFSNMIESFSKTHSNGSAMKNIPPFADLKPTPVYFPCRKEQDTIVELFKKLDTLITLQQKKLNKIKALKSAYLSDLFPKEGEKYPKLRFDGFTDAWEQRKLTDSATLFGGLTYSPNNIVKENATLVLRSSNVKNGEVIDADNVYVNPEVVNVDNVQIGDVIVVVRNGSRSLIGKHAQIKAYSNNTVIGAFMSGLRSDHPEFINALLDTKLFKAEIDKNLGATINQITNGMFNQMNFLMPSEEEREAIGSFFKTLDNLITLHQRKLEKLQNIKKAYLNELFI